MRAILSNLLVLAVPALVALAVGAVAFWVSAADRSREDLRRMSMDSRSTPLEDFVAGALSRGD